MKWVKLWNDIDKWTAAYKELIPTETLLNSSYKKLSYIALLYAAKALAYIANKKSQNVHMLEQTDKSSLVIWRLTVPSLHFSIHSVKSSRMMVLRLKKIEYQKLSFLFAGLWRLWCAAEKVHAQLDSDVICLIDNRTLQRRLFCG